MQGKKSSVLRDSSIQQDNLYTQVLSVLSVIQCSNARLFLSNTKGNCSWCQLLALEILGWHCCCLDGHWTWIIKSSHVCFFFTYKQVVDCKANEASGFHHTPQYQTFNTLCQNFEYFSSKSTLVLLFKKYSPARWQTVTINFKWLRKLTHKAAEKHQPILPGSHLMDMFSSLCWWQEASKMLVLPRSRRKCLMSIPHSGFWSELVSLDVVKVLGKTILQLLAEQPVSTNLLFLFSLYLSVSSHLSFSPGITIPHSYTHIHTLRHFLQTM